MFLTQESNLYLPNQNYKLLHSKGNCKQNEKTTYRLGENICKWCNLQGLNFPNIQTTHMVEYLKNTNNIIKFLIYILLQMYVSSIYLLNVTIHLAVDLIYMKFIFWLFLFLIDALNYDGLKKSSVVLIDVRIVVLCG